MQEDSTAFEVKVRQHQGSVLSPLSFLTVKKFITN